MRKASKFGRKIKWVRWILMPIGVLAASILVLYIWSFTGPNAYPNKDKQHAMLRLEDIGPGGEYGTLEGLGKLRTVIEELEKSGTPFQMTVISRSVFTQEDGTWVNRGIDDTQPDEYMKQFIRLLQEAQQHGAVLGMHGYTHQYGNVVRSDQNHISGIAREFKVPGADETYEDDYAAQRIERSLQAFAQNGLTPSFWESPHYKDTRSQEKVFRSYIGILYEPDMYSLRSLKDLNVYESVNTYGKTTLGSVYVPAPLKYITDDKSVDQLLDKASDFNGLGSIYFHPFLEFRDMEPVVDEKGQSVIQDGLPLYRYTEGETSRLHKLVAGMKQLGYRFISLHEAVPFTPANRVTLQADIERAPLLGDVTGDGQVDVVSLLKDRIEVIEGAFGLPRNQAQQAARVWLNYGITTDEQALLSDLDGDGKQDILLYNSRSGMLQISITDAGVGSDLQEAGQLPVGLTQLQEWREEAGAAGTRLIARHDGRMVVISISASGSLQWKEAEIMLPPEASIRTGHLSSDEEDDILVVPASPSEPLQVIERDNNGGFRTNPASVLPVRNSKAELMLGDTNGDGFSDMIVYESQKGLWQVYQNDGRGGFKLMDNLYGPWARGDQRLGFTIDADGNGKEDVVSYDPASFTLDFSLSYQP